MGGPIVLLDACTHHLVAACARGCLGCIPYLTTTQSGSSRESRRPRRVTKTYIISLASNTHGIVGSCCNAQVFWDGFGIVAIVASWPYILRVSRGQRSRECRHTNHSVSGRNIECIRRSFGASPLPKHIYPGICIKIDLSASPLRPTRRWSPGSCR